MYKNRHTGGRNNICGSNIARIRKSLQPKVSQRELADRLQRIGLDVDKNAVQRIESGQRFVTDIELAALSRLLGVSADELLKDKSGQGNA